MKKDSLINTITLTELRKDIYNLTDSIVTTGKPLIIERNGMLLRMSVVQNQPVDLDDQADDRLFWEKLEGLGDVVDDLDSLVNESPWSETEWEQKWHERLT